MADKGNDPGGKKRHVKDDIRDESGQRHPADEDGEFKLNDCVRLASSFLRGICQKSAAGDEPRIRYNSPHIGVDLRTRRMPSLHR